MSETILGTRIDVSTRDAITQAIHKLLLMKQSSYLVTVNPEILMWARRDTDYARILQRSSYNIADGAGLVMAGIIKKKKVSRFTGYELTELLCQIAAEERQSVFFLGGSGDTLAHRAALAMKKRFPHLHVVGAESGPKISIRNKKIKVDESEQSLILDHINLLQPKVLLVAFGHPKQEKWIAETLSRLPSVRVAVGVGGVFDYLAGSIIRAPKIFRATGLEWLFRLFRQPWRFPRVFTATVKFTYSLLRDKS